MKKEYISPVVDYVKVTLHDGVLDEQITAYGGSKETKYELAAEGKEQLEFEEDDSWGNLWDD